MNAIDANVGQEMSAVIRDLASVGYMVESLSDLRHSGARYREAVPVLLKWLSLVSDRLVKDEIVRALSVPWAKLVATRPMIDEFRPIAVSLVIRWSQHLK